MILTRRTLMAAGATVLATSPGVRPASADDDPTALFRNAIARIEADVRGRLGVAVRDTGSDAIVTYRGDERFPLCSTFKALACGAVLARVDAGQESLDRRIVFAAADLVPYSPVTQTRVGAAGMTLAEICEAAITRSDNTAGNLILASLGGPDGVTDFARAMGDGVTRLDRTETALNTAIPGDPRDTTTPAAMAANLAALVLGPRLAPASRTQLQASLLANKTGDARLRAGLPVGWRIGDKTGSGDHGTANDVGVIWPPAHAPLVVCVYLTDTSAAADVANAAIAQIARTIAGIVLP